MSDLSKKIVTYDAMEKYHTKLMSEIAKLGTGDSGLSTTDIAKLTHSVGLPIGNTDIHTWENMCIEGDTEEQHVGSVKISFYDEEYGEYCIINGTYFNVCPYNDHDSADSDDYYVLLIGTMQHENDETKHATDASLIGLNIWSYGDSVSIYFNKPIASLGSGSSNNSPISFEENIPDGINSNTGFVNLGDSSEYTVDPNSSIVIRPRDEEGNNPIIYLNYPKIGRINEYTIIINNDGVDHTETESGVFYPNIVLTMVDNNDRYLFDNSRFHWNTPPLYAFNESDKTYELNIKVVPYKEVFDEEYNRNTLLQYDAYVTWTEYTN